MSAIHNQLSRQGWRVIYQSSGQGRPRIDHDKRRLHVVDVTELVDVYLELEDYDARPDRAHELATATLRAQLLQDLEVAEAAWPDAASDSERMLIQWLQQNRTDLLPELAHVVFNRAGYDDLTGRIALLLAQPQLITSIPLESQVEGAA